ncbi:MAG: response regulator receiver modulated sensor-containing diguanylate, partial [Dehalococcoidia bacterium]|nr:response regulator receiver modulated sensor-containing diguanylate [Dehalococcoidia bacterium]
MPNVLNFFRRPSLTWRFGLAALVIIALLGVVLSLLLRQAIIESALADARADTRDTVAHRIAEYLRPTDLTEPLSSQRVAELDSFFKNAIVSKRTARVKIWSLEGRVVYADDPGIIGQVFEMEDELSEAIEGKTASELSNLKAAENVSEAGYSQLLEVYTPIIFPDSQKIAGVLEIYQVFDPIAQQIAEMQRFVTLVMSGSLAVLYLALLGIVHGGARTIDRQQRDLMQALFELRELNAQLEQRVLERTAELDAARARFQALYEDNPTMYLTVDRDGKVISVNQFGADQLGYAPAELLGQSILVLIAPEDRSVVLSQIGECVNNPWQVLQWVGRRMRKDGSILWAREVARAVTEPGGGVMVLIVSSDITEQTRAEEARARLIAILEATTDHVSTTNLNGNVLYINRSGRSMLGIAEAEIETIDKLSILDVFSEKARSILSSQAIPAAMRNGVWNGEVALLNRNGAEIPVSLVTVAHRSPNGPVEFLSYIARDITERKNLEDRLVHLANHDPLTGLFNRRRFEEEMGIQLAQAGRYATRGALAFFDLDHFKTVNDSLGHHAGDELLASVAQLLRGRLRDSDILARLGGDEFAIFMPRADAR